MRIALPLLITSFVFLSACTSYDRVWVKADATREQRKHQQTACESRGAAATAAQQCEGIGQHHQPVLHCRRTRLQK
ncbi:hypothetical protein VRB68_11005 [Pseudomonas trivialis]|uniref:hypothetical protein n=1 Tax=Pseudomonas trivialis TaxID=200450 RepID=UPI0030D22E8D